MTQLCALIKRNMKLFFKDKGMFFASLITPLILLVLYSTFLGNVYKESFQSSLAAAGATVPDKLIDGCAAAQLVSSLLAVCCVTVSFSSNLLMVQDKITSAIRDLTIAPVGKGILALSYFIANLFSTLIVCGAAAGISFIYLATAGWYMTAGDVLFLFLDILLLTLFGSALSSIINFFLSSQGQISAVSVIISAGYGFLCGAYMPISQFSDGLQKAISFLPGTYGTSLLRNHTLRGIFEEMGTLGFPEDVVEAIKDSIDCNIYFFDNKVSEPAMYMILAGSMAALIIIYVMISLLSKRTPR